MTELYCHACRRRTWLYYIDAIPYCTYCGRKILSIPLLSSNWDSDDRPQLPNDIDINHKQQEQES